LITPDWLAELRKHYDTWAQKAIIDKRFLGPDGKPPTIAMRHYICETEQEFRTFVFQSPIARAAAAIMRSSTAQLFEDTMLTEPAGSRTRSNWHQDASGWPLSGNQLASVWFSLEAAGRDTGSMRFVEGSHRGPAYDVAPHAKRPEERGKQVWKRPAFPDIDGDPDAFSIVTTETKPGDAVIFHPMAIHSAWGSAKDYARRSFTVRFMGDDIRWSPMDRLYHGWLLELPLAKGDKVVHPRLPVVWEAAPRG
jgi:ectoine hydroxylase-related dioxygenase (phytanoyl-CoA dioxygenase family)